MLTYLAAFILFKQVQISHRVIGWLL